MNRDEILTLAREAGVMPLEHFYVTDVFLQRFVHLVEQRLIRDGYRKCASGQRTTQFCGLLDAAVKAEREACAKVAESYEPTCDTCPSGVANAIRARGEQEQPR